MTNTVSSNPVLFEMLRGGKVESFHRGAFVICRADGEVLASGGNLDEVIYPRSSYKIMQALPLIESGAAEAFGLSEEELALACASHSGEPMHTERVTAWLERIGLSTDDLECGPHPSSNGDVRDALTRAGQTPQPVHNNCSGKHAGFLTLAKQIGAPTKGYTQLGHPVQRMITARIAQLCDMDPADFNVGVDGCAAPNLAMPLRNYALGLARVASGEGLAPETHAAAKQLYAAQVKYPELMSGTGRACADLIRAANGKAVVKVGAEAVYAGLVPHLGLGIALKIDDGGVRGAEAAIAALLVALDCVGADDPLVSKWLSPPWRNTRDQVVGEGRVTEVLRFGHPHTEKHDAGSGSHA